MGSNLTRSRRGGTRTGLRGIRSGCVTGVRRVLTRGSGRVVAMWLGCGLQTAVRVYMWQPRDFLGDPWLMADYLWGVGKLMVGGAND